MPTDGFGVEAELARLLRERAARLREDLEALAEEYSEPISLKSLAALSEAPAPGGAGGTGAEFLAETVRALASCGDQIALLDRLLEGTARCFSRVCLFIVRGEAAHGWSSVGLPESEQGDPAKSLNVSLRVDSILRSAVESRASVRENISESGADFLPPLRPGDRMPENALAAPLLVQEKVAAVLYADDGGDGRKAGDFSSAEILANVAAMAANLLAHLSHPEAPDAEMEAESEVEIRVPAAAEGGSLAGDFFGPDLLEEDFQADAPAASHTAVPQDLAPEEARLHEDARRFARLLVSELLLYNEDLVILGRRQRDIYNHLKEAIDRSRQTYDQRVPRSVSARVDYFTQEMVHTLAGGDSAALGPGLAP